MDDSGDVSTYPQTAADRPGRGALALPCSAPWAASCAAPEVHTPTALPDPHGALWQALGEALEGGDLAEASALYGLLDRRARVRGGRS